MYWNIILKYLGLYALFSVNLTNYLLEYFSNSHLNNFILLSKVSYFTHLFRHFFPLALCLIEKKKSGQEVSLLWDLKLKFTSHSGVVTLIFADKVQKFRFDSFTQWFSECGARTSRSPNNPLQKRWVISSGTKL